MIGARQQGKHIFIWDKTGLVPTEFENFGINVEFTVDMVNVAIAKDNIESVLNQGLQGLHSALC